AAREEVDALVVVDGAHDVVEVDPAVEEAPRDVAHEGTQVVAGVHRVAQLAAVARRPLDVGEVFVAAEMEAAQRECAVAEDGVGLGGLDGNRGGRGGGGHDRAPVSGRSVQCVWQISAQRSTETSPLQVWITSTPGFALRNW